MPDQRVTLQPHQLRELLSYDEETGVFRWRASIGRQQAGAVAGGLNGHGYRVVRIAGRLHMAHRLAWLYVTGEWPTGQLDHVNGDGLDNRFANLRPCTNAQNAQNQRRDRRSASGVLGVHKAYKPGKWKARIKLAGVETHLGLFDSVPAAAAAYEAAKRCAHPFAGSARA